MAVVALCFVLPPEAENPESYIHGSEYLILHYLLPASPAVEQDECQAFVVVVVFVALLLGLLLSLLCLLSLLLCLLLLLFSWRYRHRCCCYCWCRLLGMLFFILSLLLY